MSLIDSAANNLQATTIEHQPQNLGTMMNRTVSMIENIDQQAEVELEEIGPEVEYDVKENTPPAESGNYFNFLKF